MTPMCWVRLLLLLLQYLRVRLCVWDVGSQRQ